MSFEYSEDQLVQKTTTDFLYNQLGWEAALAFDEEILGIDGSFGRLDRGQVVLTRYLEASLRKLNPNLPNSVYQQALDTIDQYSTAKTEVQINREKHDLFREGVPITYRAEDGKEKTVRLKVFDFESPGNNHFLAIRELWIQGDVKLQRADIIGFVNGLPLVFIECKATHKSLKAAYNSNLMRYKAYIPRLFHHNAIIILTNGIEARFGSVTSPYEYFQEWKRLSEDETGRIDLETLLRGLCDKSTLMDLVENFILFDESKGELRKIIGRNHQYLGVNRAFEAVKERDEREGKLGVFWHTQGSGKSYSMAFLSRKVHRRLPGNFTFLVLTDREDLDTQIYKTFAGIDEVDNDKDRCRAGSGTDLRELLKQNKRFVFSLIQKFNLDEKDPYSLRDDIIVISDEAHRTQYGLFARRMRAALPNAAFIGFTGTPLIGGSEDELTKETFGDYISKYDFQRAVEDEATVPLHYDNRGEKLGIAHDDLNTNIAEVLESYEPDEDQETRLRRVLAGDYLLLTNQDRLDRIAQDFVEHYTARWQTGKAMMICLDKITTVRMHGLVDRYWKKKIKAQRIRLRKATDEQDETEQQQFLSWLEDTERLVVISEAADEVHVFNEWGIDIVPHRKAIKDRDLETEFKKDSHPFRVAFVCAMWLTGFDVESLATLYVDKPMKGHTLMQAIARANRVKEGKPNGLIVDYNGILRSLRKALATYTSVRADGASSSSVVDPVKPEDELLKAYAQDVAACVEYLASLGYDLKDLIEADGFEKSEQIVTATEMVSRNDNTLAKFEVMATQIFTKAKSLVSNKGLYRYKREHDAIEAIYKRLKKTDSDPADIIEVLKELQAVVDEAVGVEPSGLSPGDQSGKIYDMSQINIDRLRQEFDKVPNPNLAVQSLKDKVEQKLNRMVQINPTRMDYYELYQQIVDEYNREQDRATIEQTFEELLDFIKTLNDEEKRAAREELTEKQLAVFDLLCKNKPLTGTKRERVKDVAAELLETIQAAVADMDNWTEKETTQAAVKSMILDYLYDENSGLPIDDYSDDEVEIIAKDFFQYVYLQARPQRGYEYMN